MARWRGRTRKRPEHAGQTNEWSLRFNRNTNGDTSALGRSRDGLGTKIVGVCDAAGRLVDFVVVPGQAHELARSLLLLKRLPEALGRALANMACDRRNSCSLARAMGAFLVVPSCKSARHARPRPAYTIAIGI